MNAFNLDAYLEDFAQVVKSQKLLTRDWVLNGYWCQNRWLHAAVWGALVKAVPSGLVPMVEPSTEPDFKPDLVILDTEHKKQAVIEYESANSSDERLVLKDLAHFKAAILSYRRRADHSEEPGWFLPPVWLLISTLPSCRVTDWPWHGYNVNPCAGPADKSREARNQAPLKYYEDTLHAAFAEHWGAITEKMPSLEDEGIKLVWANIDEEGIRIKNVNGIRQERDAIPLFNQERSRQVTLDTSPA